MDHPEVVAYYRELLGHDYIGEASVANLIESHKRIRQIVVDMPRPFPPSSDASFWFKFKWCVNYLRGKFY